MTDKTVVITGATSGIGFATALGLAQQGAFVIAIGRSQERCSQAEATIKEQYPKAKITFATADLSSLNQVKGVAKKIIQIVQAKGNAIDVLINNAGTFSSWYILTSEGFELQFAVNHLAPFLLTHELLPLLKSSPEGRVITVSSGSHYHTRLNWNDLQMHRHYNSLWAYKRSKLANVLFTNEFNHRVNKEESLRAFAVDPGLVNTDMGLKGTMGLARWIWKKRREKGVTPAEGAASSIFLASDSLAEGNTAIYWKNCLPCQPSRYALRKDVAQRLWKASEQMCGINDYFDID